ncbi:hypothetical protein HY496_00810 [Candidatus Woesearchaeota archaeon]|nr:hypothetical protein [Candidatus Woesearchaeota archaeon]
MVNEIEKKYLLSEKGIDFSTDALSPIYASIDQLTEDVLKRGKSIRQGYLPLTAGLELGAILKLDIPFEPCEARLRDKAKTFYFTIKGDGGLARSELEAEIDQTIFEAWWPQTEGKRVEKVRLSKPYQRYCLEIDVYTDRDLIVAEVEVPTREEAEKLVPLGKDITEERRYKNKTLAK